VRWLAIPALAMILCSSTAASAGDVCLLDDVNGAAFILKKVRIPRRPGDAVPVSGIGLTSTASNGLPVSGTLIRDINGDLFLGLTRHFQRCLIGFVLNESLEGSVSYDCNLDNANDATGSVGRFDCDEI
jgi:hypothetical protein